MDRFPQLEVDLGKLQENLTALKERCQDSFVGIIGVVKGVNAAKKKAEKLKKKEEEKKEEKPAEPSAEEKLLTEIRDLLKEGK